MKPSRSRFPDLETLTAGLSAVICDDGSPGCRLTIIRRQPNAYASTSESEVVTCRIAGRGEVRVFCKYGVGYLDCGSARRGVPYEVEVYNQVLGDVQLSTPRFYGYYENESTGRTWMVLEYLDGYQRVDLAVEQDAILLAARWIGQFHAATEGTLSSGSVSFLNSYDTGYYAARRQRTLLIPKDLRRSYPWLSDLCQQSDEVAALLVTASPAVIHGEFYPSNALVRDGEVFVVDWESTGIGAGELDLAALTLGPWPEEVVQACEEEYRLVRWAARAPSSFGSALTAARLYCCLQVLFHWLTFRPDRAAKEVWLYQLMRSAGDRLGLV